MINPTKLRIRRNSSFVYKIPATTWFDHVENEKRNLITLYAKKFGLTNPEAYRIIAEKCGNEFFSYMQSSIVHKQQINDIQIRADQS